MIDVMIITYNESLNLPRCLRALEGWTKKVFVVDSGSSDGTREIARSFGAEVVQHDWEGYARQKNWALENLPLTAPWTLIVDADEVITETLQQRLVEIASKPVDEVPYDGYFINRLTYFLGQPIHHCGYFPSWNLRLFKRGKGYYEDREVHEHVVIDEPVAYIDEPMLHDDRRGLENYIAKHNRYSTLEARARFMEAMEKPPREMARVSPDTRRRRRLKRLAQRVPMPGVWLFLYMYLIRRGILDGRAGLNFCRLIAMYESMVALKLRELRRAAKRGQLDLNAAAPPAAGLAVPEGYAGSITAGLPDRLISSAPVGPVAEPQIDATLDTSTEGFLTQRLGERVKPGTRVLITGGSGFIGTNLVQLYHLGGAEVINLDRNPPRNPAHRDLWRKVDILDADRLLRAVRDFEPELFFHLAARTDLIKNATTSDYDANISGTDNALKAVEGLSSMRRMIITSTQLVCRPGYRPRGDADYAPHTQYGRSKVETERVTRAWKNPPCPWTLVRPTSIWGPWFDTPYRDFFMTIARRQYRHPRGTNPLRSFGFVGNAVFEYVALVEAPEALVDRRTLYMSELEAVRVRDWARMIQAEMGLPSLREVSIPMLTVAAKAGDLLHGLGLKWPPITSFRLQNLLADNYCDMGPVAEIVGPMPYTVPEGVRITVRWMREAGLI